MSTWKNPDGSTSTGVREDFIFDKPEKVEHEEKPVTEEKPRKKTSKKK